LIWLKERGGEANHKLHDIIRGTDKQLQSNSAGGHETVTDQVTSFDTDGFTLGDSNDVNQNEENFIAWCWNAGSEDAETNDDGSIDSEVKANPSAGFSIISYDGEGNDGDSIGHGLNAKPAFAIFKILDTSWNFNVYHQDLGNSHTLYLNTNGAEDAQSNWADMSSSVITFTSSISNTNNSGNPFICYAWAEVEGFSKFGSYEGSSDLPFIWCGFKPRWLLTKRTDGGSNDWQIVDTARSTFNVADDVIKPNSADVEGEDADYSVDFLSNGFKHRTTHVARNGSGNDYIFAAFAETPFKYSNAN
jgi:hypothetical protein